MINTIIAKTSTSKRVIDFRDGLVVANNDDYAMLFGIGGKNHAPVSVIPVTVCDFSVGTGDRSRTCTANLEVDVISQLYEVAKDRILHPVTAQKRGTQATGIHLSDMAWNNLNQCLDILRASLQNPGYIDGDNLVSLGQMLRAVCDDGAGSLNGRQSQAAPAKPAYGKKQPTANADYMHQQVRVNIYKKGADGLPSNVAPVQKLTILHTPFDDNGNIHGAPWLFTIANGAAEPNVSDNGAITFKSNTYQEFNSVFMNVSDADMFRMMDACQRYIQTFTMCFGVPLVKAGVEQKRREREEWRAQNGYGAQNQAAPAQQPQGGYQPNGNGGGYAPQGQGGYQPKGASQQQKQSAGGYQPKGASQQQKQSAGGYQPNGVSANQQQNQNSGGYQSCPAAQQQGNGGANQSNHARTGRAQASGYRPAGYQPANL